MTERELHVDSMRIVNSIVGGTDIKEKVAQWQEQFTAQMDAGKPNLYNVMRVEQE